MSKIRTATAKALNLQPDDDEVTTSTTNNVQSANPDEGITNDEGATSSKRKYDALNILKNIHEEAVQELFYKWDMEKLLSLIQRTFDFIAGVNDDKKWSEYDLMYEWTDFTHFYTSAFYTRSNYFSVECSKEALIDE